AVKTPSAPRFLLAFLLLWFASPCTAEDGTLQMSYVKFEWRGEIQAAHQEALKVLKKAGYRVPAGQEQMTFSCYGTLPEGVIATTLMAHILCSTVKHGDKFFTNVTIVTASADMTQAAAESEKLHGLMKAINGEEAGTVTQGQHQSHQSGTNPVPGTLFYAHDVRTTYSGTLKNATETAHRILEEMDFSPGAMDEAKPPELQAGSKASGSVGALIVTTSDDLNHQVQVHLYAAVRYQVPKGASHAQLVTGMGTAKTEAIRYADEMAHIMGGDPGNSIKPAHSK
ncbi:MAG: hypothetical protein JWO94_3866, partial [Verrucomicrobiaceae bacterium]|nr:hypothetical protein [Verrucomicrobiaceae bacterium]